MNSNDVLADFNDDEVTSSGKNKIFLSCQLHVFV